MRLLFASTWWMVLLFIAGGCAPDEKRIEPSDRWPETGSQNTVSEPVPLADRSEGGSYGLPKNGLPSIQDLISVLPVDDVGRDDPKFFSSNAQPLSCSNGRTTQSASLPMTVEGVVTIPGTYYIKVSVCDQEEKFYGSYVIEDDTGGIMVLRDSRVAQVQPGDVVRMTVHTIAVSDNLGRTDSRAVLSYELEILPEKKDVLYQRTQSPLTTEDVGRTRQVEGYAIELPTNLNFSTLVLSDKNFPVTDSSGSSVCQNYCQPACATACVGAGTSDVCETRICPALCAEYDAENAGGGDPTEFLTDRLPTCWVVGLNQELLRRGYNFADANRLRATGPVLRDYSSLTVTVEKLGQIEILE
jgi:hypothetical protein